MLKINANIAKRVPIPGVDYSSQQFACGMEVEVPSSEKPEAIRDRIRRVFEMLQAEVDQQILDVKNGRASTVSGTAQAGSRDVNNGGNRSRAKANGNASASRPRNGNGSEGNGNRCPAPATQAQAKAIWAIAKRTRMDLGQALSKYRVTDPADLTIKQASQLIDQLKGK